LPDLIRQSIRFEKSVFAKMMDARVKPAHDRVSCFPGAMQRAALLR
jgi:hypothetical protein